MSGATTPHRIPTTREEAMRALGTPDAEARRLVVRALESAPTEAAHGVLRAVLSDDDWRVRKEAIQLAHALAERSDVVPLLVEALRAPSEEVALRNAAVEALAGLGASAVEAVEGALIAGVLDADGRKLAVEVLAAARQARSLPIVLAAADDDDPNVRAAAAEAIGLIGGDAAAAALSAILDRDDRFLRLIALEGLNRLGAPVSLARLSTFLDDKILRHAAIAALARTCDAGAFAPLVSTLSDPSRHVAETSMRAFAALSRSVQDAAAAGAAVATIGALGRERVLSAASSASDLHVRRGALSIVALIGDAAAVDLLVRALVDDELTEEAQDLLVALGPRALPPLLDAARYASETTARAAAIQILPRFGAHAEVVHALRVALRDKDVEVASAAASAFSSAFSFGAMLPSAEDVRELLRTAARREPKVSATALQSLRALARRLADAVRPHLVDVDTGSDEAPIACALLSVIGGAEHVPWLSRALSAEAARTRRAAVEALGQIGGEGAARAIALAITDEDADVALAAIKALGRARDESGALAVGVTPLLRLLQSSDDAALRGAAARALGNTGDRAAADALRPLIGDANVAVSCSALEALAELEVDDLADIASSALGHPSTVVVRAALDVLDGLVARDGEDGKHRARITAEAATALVHASWEVRRRAVELLARLEPRAVRPILQSRASVETEPAVRDAIDRAIAALDMLSLSQRPPSPPSSFPPIGDG